MHLPCDEATFIENSVAFAGSNWRDLMLFQIDRAWRDHLALAADLREGIHLVGLGGQDPLTRFTTEMALAFRRMETTIDDAVLDVLEQVRVSGRRVDLEGLIAGRLR